MQLRDDLSDTDKLVLFHGHDIFVTIAALASAVMLMGMLLNWLAYKRACVSVNSGSLCGICFGFNPVATICSLLLANLYVIGYWWINEMFWVVILMPPIVLWLTILLFIGAIVEFFIATYSRGYCTVVVLSEGFLKIYRPVVPPERIKLKHVGAISMQRNRNGMSKRLNIEISPSDGTVDILQLPGLRWIFGSFKLTKIATINKLAGRDSLAELYRLLTAICARNAP